MIQKRKKSKLKIMLILCSVALVAGSIVMMNKDVATARQPVEKELDAKGFFGEKQ